MRFAKLFCSSNSLFLVDPKIEWIGVSRSVTYLTVTSLRNTKVYSSQARNLRVASPGVEGAKLSL